ncbi:SOS response-associated peptidase [Prosthecobacter dejongeii]|uniref:Abasic site processing protein n=1 Tax=Prosthecobacter dejongeii TaxID=48465 RepID=A0A7W7YLL1_9BACT|nr:SOS response-associated peptidase family protein [Prosthecobacter dejongeii]MBB5038279.1 putative SOS response-associated peptidase YedK [Prosthecobacter dejongeii]
MCNRYHYSGRDISRIVERLRVYPIAQEPTDIWPSKPAPVLLQRHDHHAAIEMMPWGIQPDWQRSLLLFARFETAAIKQSFRMAYRMRRCLVLATGFWETRYFESPDQPMVIAGIYDSWYEGRDTPSHGFTMLSAPATPAVQPYNDRMPLILPEEAWQTWLDPISTLEQLAPLMRPWQGELVTKDQPTLSPPRPIEKPDPTEQLELQW